MANKPKLTPKAEPPKPVTRLKAWPKKNLPAGKTMTEQSAEAAQQAASDAASAAPSPHAPGFEAERLDVPNAAPQDGANTENTPLA